METMEKSFCIGPGKPNLRRCSFFLPSLAGGGAERVFVNLANGFASQGLKVDMVLAQATGPYLSHLDSAVRLVDFQTTRTLLALPALVRYLRQSKPDVVISGMPHANIVALAACRLARTATRPVVTEHVDASASCRPFLPTKDRILLAFRGRFYRHAYRIIAVSSGTAQALSLATGISLDKIRVIYNPIVSPALFLQAQEPIHHPWFAGGSPPVILGAGRLCAQKDFATLIHAFALVLEKANARLVIVGDGEDRRHLETLITRLQLNSRVEMPGFVANPFAYMRRAAVFVLSSRWEGFGNVLVEAMACGTPVVSTDCPSGPAEILGHGQCGALVPVGDASALAQAILAVLQHPPDTERLRQRAEQFSVAQAVTQYLEAIEL